MSVTQAAFKDGQKWDLNEEESDFEEYYDACSDHYDFDSYKTDFKTSIEHAELALQYFFNNQFDEARNILQPFAETSFYHSLGYAVFSFLEAMLTFENVEGASAKIKKCIELCQLFRKKNTLTESITSTFKKKNYSQLTDQECHAELCLAEALLMNALLTFIEDDNLSGLIRGSLKVRQCYSGFRACEQIMKSREWIFDVVKDSASVSTHFASGVYMGIGTFNLMISILPGRILNILKFIGFTGSKTTGLDYLKKGNREKGLRQILCGLSLLGYYLVVIAMLSDRHSDSDVQFCDEILTAQLAKYPKGGWILFLKGRLELIKGNLFAAELWYLKSVHSQITWPQLHHLSFWELFWLNSLMGNWAEAELYATYLLKNSSWSRTIYTYHLAAVKLACIQQRRTTACNITDPDIEALMLEVPAFRQRISGKSLPMEKFMIKRAVRFGAQNSDLVLPLIELMYLWNIFKLIKANSLIADDILQTINKELVLLKDPSQTSQLYYADNRALCLLLRGAFYRQMEQPNLALQDLHDCLTQRGIKEDLFLLPYAYVESALCYVPFNKNQAISMLQDTKKKFSHYALESRLHLRIHMALMDLNDNTDGEL
ncbi:tetratricopeptide repeat protein 39B-like isoform X2 [Drosophila miranda]|uniref:tetratricopeptide repeat protein 39B-like isoform X2 n=1 Tax=Drosophila miranda TaxID=7229 RepID=UPI0007E88494|nr:tetratricopeptide repeat protein 39B-like isoform X2 [Drosophila miranda]XP_017155609.1 tetratricopeptide repeat protein 39B-like isoform X2 [Drosophila miranda]XP_017155610.1 tetratricopeptide repeat protein 39B-like isoform X2 [Drosophila miranda]XP_017155611.1 tetratricopeptide repeat protein 39B-like isoform X2 [Drosophila miranda]XP_017155613.1 tetratricopeptide repeat protein 39B-like isoform X2 [Drosophila miranda]